MRLVSLVAFLALCSTGVFAQDEAEPLDTCAHTEAWFKMGVDARLLGDNQRKVRRMLIKEMGRTAGEQLSEFIFALPEEQLTPEVGKAARAQCEAL
jgi:hypothetical protein